MILLYTKSIEMYTGFTGKNIKSYRESILYYIQNLYSIQYYIYYYEGRIFPM